MARNKENYNAWLREYYKKHKKQYFEKAANHKKKMREWFENEYKDILFCIKCGEKERCCLDFHHLNPSEKESTVLLLVRQSSKKKVIEEVKKCIVVCANCHRKIHASLSQ